MFRRRSSRTGNGEASEAPPHPDPDADGVCRAIPKDVWEGPQGDFLRKIGLILVALACLLSTPGWATPERIIRVDDSILGENDTHLFLLRRIDDNLGYYQTLQTDVVLIARNLSTGRDDTTWRVISIRDHGPYFAESNRAHQVEDLGVEDRVDPFDVLLGQHARTVLPDTATAWGGRMARITGDGIEVALEDAEATHRISLADAASLMAASLGATGALVPARKSETGGDRLSNLRIDVAGDCEIGALHGYRTSIDPNRRDYAVRLDCGDAGGLMPLSLYVVVPPAS